jgi:Ca2+-binding EF-hand superfamily protein
MDTRSAAASAAADTLRQIEIVARKSRLPKARSCFEGGTISPIKTRLVTKPGTFGSPPDPIKKVKRPRPPSQETESLHRIMLIFVAAAFKHKRPMRDFLLALDMSDGDCDGNIDIDNLNGGLADFGITLTRHEVDVLLNNLTITEAGGFAVDEFVELITLARSRLLTGGGSVYAQAMQILKSRMTAAAIEHRRASQEAALGEQDRQSTRTLANGLYERNTSLSSIFRKCDKEADGEIPRKDFIETIHQYNVGLSRRQCGNIAAFVDSRQTGRIDYLCLVQIVQESFASHMDNGHPGQLILSPDDISYSAVVTETQAHVVSRDVPPLVLPLIIFRSAEGKHR